MQGGARRSRPAEVHLWLQALFDESPMAIGFSRDGVVLDANPAFLRLFGHASVSELAGTSLLEQIAPSERARIAQKVAARARGERSPGCYRTRGVRKDGTEFALEITTTRVVVADGPLTIAFLADVSEHDDALEALRASEEMFRTLSAAAFEGVFVHAEGRVVLANDAGAAMYGVDPPSLVGATLMELAAPESRPVVADHVRRGASEPYEAVAQRRDGTTFIVEIRGKTLSHQGRPMRVSVLRDVTERRRAEVEQRALAERVRHAQKLESLGVLAGGVAHDFNNILTVITNGVALAKRDDGPGAPSVHLDAIALAAERAADLCRQMLAYTGKAALARQHVDLTALVAEIAGMLEVSIAKNVMLVRRLAPGLLPVLGDATQIRQVVMNLVVNASEAITAPAGTIDVSTGMGAYDASAFARSAAGGDPKDGSYVFVEVRDDGAGMSAATIAQMFDPFFTTKFVGRGLGMAAVLGIVRGHGGAIDVESSPGQGTRIRVFFPASAQTVPSPPPSAPEGAKGSGVVLVVDDEKNVRTSTRLLLEDFGFEVIVAVDGLDAVDVFRTHSARIGAVLLDLTMPRMDGIATLRELRAIAPEVPVVLTSGYGATRLEGSRSGPKPGVAPDAVLPKPYTADRLLAALQRVMRPPG